MTDTITIAISKGRILDEALPLLARADIVPKEDPSDSRKLVLATNQPGVQLFIIRAADVPTYVVYGAADMGIAGKDVLLEYEGDELYEPLDLGIARCRMMLAGPAQARRPNGRLRIATKYTSCARNYFAERGMQVEIIRLYGSMELAPLLGLSDQIVDLVDTGNTLKANGLVPLETLFEISSRLVVNKASMKMKADRIKPMIAKLSETVGL